MSQIKISNKQIEWSRQVLANQIIARLDPDPKNHTRTCKQAEMFIQVVNISNFKEEM